jgi:hypothetical protein
MIERNGSTCRSVSLLDGVRVDNASKLWTDALGLDMGHPNSVTATLDTIRQANAPARRQGGAGLSILFCRGMGVGRGGGGGAFQTGTRGVTPSL